MGIRSNHMDMTKFESADDPGFKAVVGELRRWIREIIKTENGRLSELRAEHAQGQDANEEARKRTSEQQFRRITQGGSHFGPTSVIGGSLFQGNYVG